MRTGATGATGRDSAAADVTGDATDPDPTAWAADGAVYLLWPFLTPGGADAVAGAIGGRRADHVGQAGASRAVR